MSPETEVRWAHDAVGTSNERVRATATVSFTVHLQDLGVGKRDPGVTRSDAGQVPVWALRPSGGILSRPGDRVTFERSTANRSPQRPKPAMISSHTIPPSARSSPIAVMSSFWGTRRSRSGVAGPARESRARVWHGETHPQP